MTDRDPTETINVDRYGHATIPWSRAHDVLVNEKLGPTTPGVLGTTSPDARPHATGIGAQFLDGDLYFTSGPGTRKSRNLAANPAATLAVRVGGMDLVFDGDVERVTDLPTLERLAAIYRGGHWPATVDTEERAFTAPFSAPTAGPPPWYVYRLVFHSVLGLGLVEPHGATRWRFAR